MKTSSPSATTEVFVFVDSDERLEERQFGCVKKSDDFDKPRVFTTHAIVSLLIATLSDLLLVLQSAFFCWVSVNRTETVVEMNCELPDAKWRL